MILLNNKFVCNFIYIYWAFITPEIFIFIPFGAIYPGFPTPALESGTSVIWTDL
jgi:hypothetical protein